MLDHITYAKFKIYYRKPLVEKAQINGVDTKDGNKQNHMTTSEILSLMTSLISSSSYRDKLITIT